MTDKYAHIPGCNCASCAEIERQRKETGISEWNHKIGCGCSKCTQVENLREQAELSKRLAEKRKI